MPTANYQSLPSSASPPVTVAATYFFLPDTQTLIHPRWDINFPCLRVQSCLSLCSERWRAAWGSRSVRWGLLQTQGNCSSSFLPLSSFESLACAFLWLSPSGPHRDPLPGQLCKQQISISLMAGWGRREDEGIGLDCPGCRGCKQSLWQVCIRIVKFLPCWWWSCRGRPGS